MKIEIFIEELSSRFQSAGDIVPVACTNNVAGLPMPRYDVIRFVETKPSGMDVHIRNLQTQSPEVVIDVKGISAMRYALGTSAADAVKMATTQYQAEPQVLSLIRKYATDIADAYDVTLSYDRACVLFNIYQTTGNAQLLHQAAAELTNKTFYSAEIYQLNIAIRTALAQKSSSCP